MTNPMPTFIALRNMVELGTISAVSYAQAKKRARTAYGRCEVIAVGNVAIDRKGRYEDSRTHGRAPYATPGFEARRAALIAEYEAGR
ncbi:hypothetical protein [Sphingobium sp. MK2]|uniref:hypothetical protein n=1 Tax=Sphingobium sp. MK2 TaxID=3116540 RepID=UPI0032E3635C